MPAAINNISFINANPCEDVAVYVLEPVADAPIAALIAECSDSQDIGIASNSPLLIYLIKNIETLIY